MIQNKIDIINLKEKWLNLYKNNKEIFRNSIEKVKIRQIGKYFAYFNEDFIKSKRETQNTFKQDEIVVEKEFNQKSFNFNKVNESEILCEYLIDGISNKLIINASPISLFHSIFTPYINFNFPQVFNEKCSILALELLDKTSEDCFKLIYNSLGAFSSVNHLHFQLIFEDNNNFKIFPIENSEKKLITKFDKDINLYELINYPLKGFMLEFSNEKNYKKFGEFTFNFISKYFLNLKIAHNLIYTEKGRKIYLMPRKFENFNYEYLGDKIRGASIEIAGIAICRTQEFFNNLNEKEYEFLLKENLSLDENKFNKIKSDIIDG